MARFKKKKSMNIDLWGWRKNVTHAYILLMKKIINQLTLVPLPNNHHDKR